MIKQFKFLSGVKSMLDMYGREINPNHYQTISLTGNLRFLKEYHRRLDSHYASHYNIFNENQIYDRTKLGWIADEVENIYPKAVSKKNAYNLNDCKTLNIDQIIASIYGCSQKIIQNYENIDTDILDLENKLNYIENFIQNLNIES